MLQMVMLRLKPLWLKSLICLELSLLRLIPLWLKGLRLKPKNLNPGMLSCTQRSTHPCMQHIIIMCTLMNACHLHILELIILVEDKCKTFMLRSIINLLMLDDPSA